MSPPPPPPPPFAFYPFTCTSGDAMETVFAAENLALSSALAICSQEGKALLQVHGTLVVVN
eukprot:1279507-Pleurochrysis_carterae.AAC.1